jgi:hypothetical protein
MGTYKQGILGSFMGKIGSVIGSSWRGIYYMRIMPASVSNPQTPAQMEQRAKFSTAFAFLKPLVSFLRQSYKAAAIEMSEINAAMSDCILNNILGTYPDFYVDYETLLVSTGPLQSVPSATAVADGGGDISITWDDNTGVGNAAADDIATIVIYNPDLPDIDVDLTAATRADGTATVTVPAIYVGSDVHVYLVLNTGVGGDFANSVYAGTVTVS